MLCFRFIHFRLISVMFQSPILHSPCNFRFGLVLFHFVLSILSVGFVCLERESAESLHVAYGYGYQYGYGLKSYAVHTREWMAHPHIHLTHWLQGWKLISYFRCGCCCCWFAVFVQFFLYWLSAARYYFHTLNSSFHKVVVTFFTRFFIPFIHLLLWLTASLAPSIQTHTLTHVHIYSFWWVAQALHEEKLYIKRTFFFSSYIVLDLFHKRFHCCFSVVFMYKRRVECKQTWARALEDEQQNQQQ